MIAATWKITQVGFYEKSLAQRFDPNMGINALKISMEDLPFHL